jgi:GMP synthase (glutamine-hydrolysing)
MGTDKVLIIQNDPVENLGLYEAILRGRAHVDVIHAYSMKTCDLFPKTDSYSAFIVGPTPISANEIQKHAFLVREWEYLTKVVDSGKPILGVCCGGQILARLLGAEVVKSPRKEVGGYTVNLTEAGSNDPLFHNFPRELPVFHWHSDMFKVPSGGLLLARGEPCPIQAYNWKNVRGIIFHLEIDSHEAERWASAYPEELEVVGKTKTQVIEECRVREPEMRHLAELLVDNFLALE